MKKLLVYILPIALVFTFAACVSDVGNTPEPSNNGETTASSTENDTITSLVMNQEDAQELKVGKTFKSYVKVEPSKFDAGHVEFVVMHPEIASVEKGTDTSGAVWFTVTAKAPGKTGVYAQTPDGQIKTKPIAITIYE